MRRIAGTRTVARPTGSASQVAGSAPARKPDSWYVAEWPRLAAAVTGPNGRTETAATDAGPQPANAGDILALANRQRAEASLAEALARGDSLESAACASIRSLTATGDWRDLNAAWALAEGIGRTAGGAIASTLGHAILVHHRRQFDRVWALLHDLPDTGKTGGVGATYAGAKAHAGTGFWLELVGSSLAAACGAFATWRTPPPRRGRTGPQAKPEETPA